MIISLVFIYLWFMGFDSGSTWFVSYMLMDTFHIAFYDDFSFHGVCYDIYVPLCILETFESGD